MFIVISLLLHLPILFISEPHNRWESNESDSVIALQFNTASTQSQTDLNQSSITSQEIVPEESKTESIAKPAQTIKPKLQQALQQKFSTIPKNKVAPDDTTNHLKTSLTVNPLALEQYELEEPVTSTVKQEKYRTQPSARNRTKIDDLKKILTVNLQKELAKHFSYPLLARKRNWQGEVILEFILEPDGIINNPQIIHSSGYKILDRAALASLNKIKQIKLRTSQSLSFKLPVAYKLQEG